MNWYIACSDCQEPVGKPTWAQGCACEGALNENQAALLALINDQWDSIEWEQADAE